MKVKTPSPVDLEIQQHLDALKALQKSREDELKANREANPRKMRFTFTPATERESSWDKIMDPSCRWYVLRGEVTNAEELRQFYSDRDLDGGSMKYLWNGATNRIVMRAGGGMIYIQEDRWGNNDLSNEELQAQASRVYHALEAFITARPEGGDVTAIIKSQKGTRYE